MIIDSHCHLEYEPIISNLSKVVKRAFECDVRYLLSISTTDDSFLRILEIIEKYKNVYGTYGIHPHETKNYKNLNKEEIIKKISLSKKVIGIGETGLDFYYEHSDPETQKNIFIQHIKKEILNTMQYIYASCSASKALRVLAAETWLTVYRRPRVVSVENFKF